MKDMGHRAAVEAALGFEKGDRTPVNNFALVTAARSYGYKVSEARFDPKLSAKVSVDYAVRTLSDFVKPVVDSQVPFADMGMDVDFPEDDYGRVRSKLVSEPEDVDKLAFFDPSAASECPRFTKCFTEALEETSRILPEDLEVCGLTWGPISTAGYIMGVEDKLMATMMGNEEMVGKLVSKCADFVADQQMTQCAHGATVMWMADPTSSCDIISPEMFPEFSAPALKKTISKVKKASGEHAFLHICGNTRPIIPMIADTGADCLSFDHAVPVREAKKLADGKIALMGNIDPVRFMMMGTPEMVTPECYRILDEGAADGGFILAPGCECPISAPDANVIAMGHTGRDYWRDRGRL